MEEPQDWKSKVDVFSSLRNFAKENIVVVVLGAVGLVLMGVGLLQYLRPSEPIVEIIAGENGGEDSGQIVVDVSGSVENPGVYRLGSDARIGEALTSAGGLASTADRVWVSRFVNLAAPVTDGMKIYIPSRGEDTGGMVAGTQVVGGGDVVGSQAGQGNVNINTASASELDTLWGIGEARAQAIIESRPYGSVEELLTKAGIPKNVYDRIKDEVGIY